MWQGWALVVAGSALILAAIAYLLTLGYENSPVRELKGVLLEGGSSQLCFEIADEPAEREVGLSRRKSLGEFDGMVFTFPERGGGRSDTPFWMRDTLIPLDIVFVGADNRVIEVFAAEPCDNGCPLYAPEREYSFVVEMRRGEAYQFGIGPGVEVWLAGECIPFDRD